VAALAADRVAVEDPRLVAARVAGHLLDAVGVALEAVGLDGPAGRRQGAEAGREVPDALGEPADRRLVDVAVHLRQVGDAARARADGVVDLAADLPERLAVLDAGVAVPDAAALALDPQPYAQRVEGVVVPLVVGLLAGQLADGDGGAAHRVAGERL